MLCDAYNLSLVTGPTDEPVTPTQLKSNARVVGTSQDADFTLWGIAARELFEVQSDCKLLPQTWLFTIDRFPGYSYPKQPWSGTLYSPIAVPLHPFISVTSIKYDDVNDQEQTLSTDNYYVVTRHKQGVIYTVPTAAWPATSLREGSVRITVTAGFANIAAVPALAKQAIRMLVSHWNQNRELASDRNTKGVEHAWDAACQALKPGWM